MTELILKDKRSSIEFAWLDDDLAIDAENSDERVCVYLSLAQARELFNFLKTKCVDEHKGEQHDLQAKIGGIAPPTV